MNVGSPFIFNWRQVAKPVTFCLPLKLLRRYFVFGLPGDAGSPPEPRSANPREWECRLLVKSCEKHAIDIGDVIFERRSIVKRKVTLCWAKTPITPWSLQLER